MVHQLLQANASTKVGEPWKRSIRVPARIPPDAAAARVAEEAWHADTKGLKEKLDVAPEKFHHLSLRIH